MPSACGREPGGNDGEDLPGQRPAGYFEAGADPAIAGGDRRAEAMVADRRTGARQGPGGRRARGRTDRSARLNMLFPKLPRVWIILALAARLCSAQTPSMTGPLQASKPNTLDAGPLGKLSLDGVLSGLGVAGDSLRGDFSNA